MRTSLAAGVTAATIAALGCCFAGSMGAGAGLQQMDHPAAISQSVDRTHKGDRLPVAARRHVPVAVVASTSKRTPVGCDSAFSPITEPSLAHVFKRCLT